MSNRLIQSTSPYLLQHAENPVDWFPWGPEALERARREAKPIFLSIGYSACHWCHVMAHESFEDGETAQILNEHFIPVKVDREERPDLDELYMTAVQAIAGRGGWPMSVWLTPDLEPFYGGTYFPKEARYGMPSFKSLLLRIATLWRERRQDLEADARRLASALKKPASHEGEILEADLANRALDHFRTQFDARWGGFGEAPKFPPYLALDLMFRRGTDGDRLMALRTLEAMAEGGLYDQLGGGFARYSVDAQWRVPHFEKMLYDQAQLVPCYLEAARLTGLERYARIARETLDYLLRELRDAAGGFHSAEDADSEGGEGRFYTFTPREVKKVLGDAQGSRFCEAFGVTEDGDLEGQSVLHLQAPLQNEIDPELETLRQRMLEERSKRPRPGKDDKVLACWNALAIKALAQGTQVLGDPRYAEAAAECADFLQRELWREERLLRTWRQGVAHTPAFLEDHASLADALVDLYETTFEVRWLRWAEALADAMCARFRDEAGGFFFTEADQADVLARQKTGLDGSIPSGNALAARALLRLGRHLEREGFLAEAEATLRAFSGLLNRAPMATLGLLEVFDLQQAATEVVISGSLLDPRTQDLVKTAWRSRSFGACLSCVVADPELPLHRGKTIAEVAPAAHVCRGRACLRPVRKAEDLRFILTEPA